ncbi:fatty-acid--CoA ligase [Rhodococcus erythropolis CCM2595]|uniref:class I adenylate-forming enzyme family protein n=1 Tax=Rhodococcus erythropolis TaxID=1833 RepID=UPI00038DBEC1|nr:class I adenylate-forming enzyme family protein [Rhodococcus erythropolis]AGT94475.1 fatty-acid--CoA ligase [Rhodococcus erythropolis CCM2595]SUE11167.1 fatty-acid--CoA ligase [Rhodococcus erythropolis]
MTLAWPTDMPRCLDYPTTGIDAVLAGAARAYPDRIALQDGDLALTFAELHDRAQRAAGGLRALGVQPGHVVALHMVNNLWYVVAYYGALCAGAAVAPVNPTLPPAGLRDQLDDVKARVVISHPETVGIVLAADAQCVDAVVCVSATPSAPATETVLPEGVRAFGDLLQAQPLASYRVDPELVAHLQLTGGTTGCSKAVRVLNRNLVSNVIQMASWRSGLLTELDEFGGLRMQSTVDRGPHALVPGEGVNIAVAPLFHGLGLVGQNVSTLLGSTVVFTGRFDPDRMLADIERLGVTHITGSPAMYYALLASSRIGAHDLSSVRAINSGAAPFDTTSLRSLQTIFGNAWVTEGYGLSEATMGLTGAPLNSDVATPPDSVGVAIFDTELEIRDENSAVLGPGEVGEVWARGPQITDGYQNQPELTAVQFRGGWLATGDMGRLDDAGHLFLVGRSKDMIIYKGYNVYPQPLEEILCSHAAVAQAAVVGETVPVVGERVTAFVQLNRDFASESASDLQLLERELTDYVAAKVAPYQKVRSIRFVDRLPVTATGKIQKNILRNSLTVDTA